MPGRTTRSTRSQASKPTEPKQLSSPPSTPAPHKSKGQGPAPKTQQGTKETGKSKPLSSAKKRKAAGQTPGEGDDLPHNLGDTTLATPASGKKGKNNGSSSNVSPQARRRNGKAVTPKREPRTPIKKEHQSDGSDTEPATKKQKRSESTKSKKKDAKTPSKDDPELQKLANKIGLSNGSPTSAADSPTKKSKAKEHSLSPGVTPYPNWEHPTAEECKEVMNILSKLHGTVKQPERPPPPSLTSAGCGEVPSVLDALVRTCLSANTTNTNSARAFQGLVKRFGILQSGVGKGSVDWNAVRVAKFKDVEEAIHAGGLSVRKAGYIQGILNKVYEENQERAAALKDKAKAAQVQGVKEESTKEKDAEVARAEENVLSLDYMHLLSDDEAFRKLSSFNGIGAKTASCVLLFCLRRPSFAVDTHVFRLCRWLGWIPSQDWIDEENEKASGLDGEDDGSPKKKQKGKKGMPRIDRDTCFAHCETRVPDDMKYPLHYLLIKHGKTCPRCRAITGESSSGWNKGCVIEKLVRRDGARKGNGGGGEDGWEDDGEVAEGGDAEDGSDGVTEWEEDSQDD